MNNFDETRSNILQTIDNLKWAMSCTDRTIELAGVDEYIPLNDILPTYEEIESEATECKDYLLEMDNLLGEIQTKIEFLDYYEPRHARKEEE